MRGIYQGIRVIEIAGDIAGAVAGQTCATRGAEVIKLEPPQGDPLRHVDAYAPGESKLFQSLGRGKKSVVLDPQEAGPIVERLVASADVVISSSTSGVSPFAISYNEAARLNPAIIFVAVTAFGTEGPWSGEVANDLVMQAFSGPMMSERKTRADGVTPDRIRSTRFAEFGTGYMCNVGIASALFHRARTGEGQLIETSLLQNSLFLQGGRAVENDMADQGLADSRARLKEARAAGKGLREVTRPPAAPLNPYYRAYQTRDGAVFLGALTRGLRDKARAALDTDLMVRDSPDWDPKDASQMAEAQQKQQDIERRIKSKTTAEWVVILERAGIPTGEVVFPEDLADTPHLRDNQYLINVDHATAGRTLQVAPPVRFSLFPDHDRRPAPILGANTRDRL